MAQFKRNHLASTFYLAQWASEAGRVSAVRVDSGKSKEKRPENAGFRNWYWSSDPALCARVETAIRPIESAAAKAMADVVSRWPMELPNQDRMDIAMFMALQLVRSPASRERHLELEVELIREDRRNWRGELSAKQYDQFIGVITSDEFRVDSELQGVPKLSGLLASMHWTLVEFEEPLLATCDQPVQLVPFMEPGETPNVKGLPDRGMFEVQEVRFPLGPNHFLLLSWQDGNEGAIVRPENDWFASQVNRATLAQADGEWFHHPERRSTTLSPTDFGESSCFPLGPRLLAGYSSDHARSSLRRSETHAIVNQLIQDGDHETIGLVYPEESPLAA